MGERLVGTEFKEKTYDKITPELLLPRSKLVELRELLHETSGWRKLKKAKYESKGIRLSIADLDVAIPFVHYMLGINGIRLRSRFTGRSNRFSTTELELHHASSLFDLLKNGKTDAEEILNSFPNSSTEEVAPFIDALSLKNQAIEDIWGKFQKRAGVEGNKNFALGIHLANNSSELCTNDGNSYYDAAGVFNFGEFPGECGTRIQLTSQFGRIVSRPYYNGNLYRHNFSQLTTRDDIGHVATFQALTKDLLAGHLINCFSSNGNLKRIAEPYVAYGIKRLFPRHSDYSFSYKHFNTTSYSITDVPVEMDGCGDQGLYFFREWLGFYSDAFNAYKNELRKYLTDGTVPEVSSIQHVLPLIFNDCNDTYVDLSNLPPASPKKEKIPEEPHYTIGESMASENCPTCALPMTQYCEVKTDMGGNLVILRIQLYCQGHHFSSENKKIRREFLKYKDS